MDFRESIRTKPTFTLKPKIMSRQNRNQERERKNVEVKRDVAQSGNRDSRQSREHARNKQERDEMSDISGLDRHRLNDLYERSSL